MTRDLIALCFDANDPLGLARFWGGVLGWQVAALGARHIYLGQRPDEGHVVLADPEGNEICVMTQRVT
jgi:Glyoxalase-like domain